MALSFVIESLHEETKQFDFSARSDTNQAVQPQKQAKSLKFHCKKEETLYFLWKENKGAVTA